MSITERQQELLEDLAALEDAGLIYAGGEVLVFPGYDAGSLEAQIPAILTYEGRQRIASQPQERVEA